MSGYGAPSVAMAPFLNERKAIEDLTSLLKHIDDKGELKDLLENESQLNELIADNEEILFSNRAIHYLRTKNVIGCWTIDALSSQYSPDTTLALLQTSAAQAEEEAEKIADKFLDGEINVEDFIQSFQSQKTIHSLRKIKSEKLTEVLRSRMSSQYSYRL
ncbi:hypothetical protein pdam_00018388 [Pocillopora damicornis]|uniref:VPS37 C-terminal domain-containing protein n=1 Tax=Pocillopora damicornis TaxID=46731 RepID=A0A3M6U8A5_POCDA|nr:hypothetical protein pdam_00018388 [Pocillopora damicornis]